MKFEENVCRIDQAVRLKRLGFSMPAPLFSWVTCINKELKLMLSTTPLIQIKDLKSTVKTYTASELGKALPGFVTKREFGIYDFDLVIKKDGDSFIVKYVSEDTDGTGGTVLCEFIDDTEAESKADALIFLLEHKYLKLEDVRS